MQTEVWQRGPVEGIHPLLQPVAHALLQVQEEVNTLMRDFPDKFLWERPAGVASPGFHLMHIRGVCDRLFTYARNEALSSVQLTQLAEEANPDTNAKATDLLEQLNRQTGLAMAQLKQTDHHTLTDHRGVGRAKLPSTVLGLLVHCAEHSMRHTGQLLVTVTIILDQHTKR